MYGNQYGEFTFREIVFLMVVSQTSVVQHNTLQSCFISLVGPLGFAYHMEVTRIWYMLNS